MKKIAISSIGLGLILSVAWGMLSTTPARAQGLSVPGTGACEIILTELAEAYNRQNPPSPVSVPPSTGSGGGITAVLKDQAHLARVARSLKAEEEKQGLVRQVFARDTIAFVVGRDVKVTGLTSDQLTAIFSGKITNWKEVGKKEGTIRVVTREPGDSSLTVIQEQLAGFKNIVFSPSAKVILYDQATVETLDKYKNSIGFITLSSAKWAKGKLKPIALDGVAPTRENILAGKYLLVEDYAFVYKKDLTPEAKRFVDFVFSPAGKKILEANRLIAVEAR
ncbi:MAG: substrate-binding domain-containing protein [Deltaproteobacteria bacterium]|nr:substrate-binding domain-containing protein [Deltaproteobacteria bacterium]